MQISVLNYAYEDVRDEEILKYIRATNRQIEEDVAPYWSCGARLRLDGASDSALSQASIDNVLKDLRGDAIIFIASKAMLDGDLNPSGDYGYHNLNMRGTPYGFVFPELHQHSDYPWSVTLSHEALEMLADPHANRFMYGPHPNPNVECRHVYHWHEICDAVGDERYEIDGVGVSNFLLPHYFTEGEEEGPRNDFLGRVRSDGTVLGSFDVNPGGFVGFFDPQENRTDFYHAPDDDEAKSLFAERKRTMIGRRMKRFESGRD